MRVSSGHLCIYAEAPTEPTGETLPYGVFKKRPVMNPSTASGPPPFNKGGIIV